MLGFVVCPSPTPSLSPSPDHAILLVMTDNRPCLIPCPVQSPLFSGALASTTRSLDRDQERNRQSTDSILRHCPFATYIPGSHKQNSSSKASGDCGASLLSARIVFWGIRLFSMVRSYGRTRIHGSITISGGTLQKGGGLRCEAITGDCALPESVAGIADTVPVC